MPDRKSKLIAIAATLLLAACCPQKPVASNIDHNTAPTSAVEHPSADKLFRECYIDDYCFDNQRNKISSWQELDHYYVGADEKVDLLRLDPDGVIAQFAAEQADCSTLKHQLVGIHCQAAQQPENCATLELSLIEKEEAGESIDWRKLDACIIEGLRSNKVDCNDLSTDSKGYCEHSQAIISRKSDLCTTLAERAIASCGTTVAALTSDKGKNCDNPACFAEAAAIYPSQIEQMPFNCGSETDTGHARWRSQDCSEWQSRATAMQSADTAQCKDYSCVVWVVTRQLNNRAKALLPPAKPNDETLKTLAKEVCPANKTYPANLCPTAFFNRLARRHRDATLCINGYFNRAECLYDFRATLGEQPSCETVGKFAGEAEPLLQQDCKKIAAFRKAAVY